MNPIDDFSELFDRKFSELWINFMLDDEDPLSEAFGEYATELLSSWVMYAMMHDEPEAFMMMLNQISKMRKIDHVGMVAMTISGQGFNPYGNKIPPELDAILYAIAKVPSLPLIIETFNMLGHDQEAFLEGETIKFKPAA